MWCLSEVWSEDMNCIGCQEEWRIACEAVEQFGLHLATTLESDANDHFFIILVDDDGRVYVE